MAPRDHRTPFQIMQEQESQARNQSIRDDDGNELGSDPGQSFIDDATGEPDDPARQRQEARREEAEPEVVIERRSPGDIKRAEIAKRFRRNAEADGDVPFNGDPNDPEMQYGKVARQQLEPEPGASVVGEQIEPELEPVEKQPKLTKLVIRGKDVYLTDAQILERASKVEAADSYLDEGRALLEEARRAKREALASPDQHRPAGQSGEQDDEGDLDPGQRSQHPDELEAAIEQIQFGDPKEAAAAIRKVIVAQADTSADKRQEQRLIDNDLANSQRALTEFMDQNPALAKDEVANVVLENEVYRIYREDLTKLGLDAATLPKNNTELANWHRYYRVKGHKVRTAAETFSEAKTRFDKWRGVAPKVPAQQQQRQQPRVEVSVDRDARRANIPTQPTRAVAPRPDAVRQAPARKSRHDIIMDMKRSRGQPVA